MAGCLSTPPDPVSIEDWQRKLEQYVWERGNGDPNVVRDLSWEDVHRGFAIIGNAQASRSNDAFGLLVAHRKISGAPLLHLSCGDCAAAEAG